MFLSLPPCTYLVQYQLPATLQHLASRRQGQASGAALSTCLAPAPCPSGAACVAVWKSFLGNSLTLQCAPPRHHRRPAQGSLFTTSSRAEVIHLHFEAHDWDCTHFLMCFVWCVLCACLWNCGGRGDGTPQVCYLRVLCRVCSRVIRSSRDPRDHVEDG